MVPPFLCVRYLHNMLFRAVVPDPHAHVLPGAGGELGDAGAVEFRRQAGLRIQARIRPCHVRAVPSILAAVPAGAVALAALGGPAGLAGGVFLAVLVFVLVLAVLAAVLGHAYHLAGSMPAGGGNMRKNAARSLPQRKMVRKGDFSLTIRGV